MRIGKKLSRLLAAMLTAIMMVTSVPQTAAIAYASVPVEDEHLESVDADVSSEITETHDGEDSDMSESIVSSEAGEDEATQTTDETTEEYSEEVTSTEEIVLEETPEKPTMSFSSTTPSVDNMATEGWSWDMASSTLTLDGANINKGLIFFSDATIEVLNDSSVTYNNGAAILISGSSAKNLQIIGNGTLHLSTQSDSTAALRGNIADGEHNITVSGGSLTVDCVNNYGDSAVYGTNGCITVTDGATLNASVSQNTYALRCFSGASVVVKNGGTINATNTGMAAAVLFNNNGRLDVIEGGKFNTSSGEGHGIYINNDAGIDNKGIINILGKGSVVTATYTDPTRQSSAAICANNDADITIGDGGKFECRNTRTNLSMGIIRATNASVDLRGGIIEVHRLPGYSFGSRGVVAYAKTFNYDQGAMINAFIEEGASYYVMHVDKDTEDFIYAEVLRFTSAPESLYGIKSGGTVTFSVETEFANIDETPAVSYQWYKDGVKIPGATNATYEEASLIDGVYTYKCEASATFSIGKITISTEDIKVFVNAQGRTTVDKILDISGATESEDMLTEEGWKWDKDKKELTLHDALLKQVKISGVSATIINSGDSLIVTDTGMALYTSGDGKELNITGTGTLTLENTAGSTDKVLSNEDTSGLLTISGDSLVVNCISDNSYEYAVGIYDGLKITNGAQLNINSLKGYGMRIYTDGTLCVDKGSGLYIHSGYSRAIMLGNRTTATFTGEGTEVTLDIDKKRSERSISVEGNRIEVSDHAKLTVNNCDTNAYEELDLYIGTLDILGGILEFNAPLGESFPADKRIIRAGAGKLLYNQAGISNGYYNKDISYEYLYTETVTAKWVYKGDTPYINYIKQPVSKYVINGSTATLDAEAEVAFGEEGQIITYQWYKDGVEIAGATDAGYTTEEMTDVSSEYYCIAGATVNGVDISLKSDVVSVVANFSGKAVRTETLNLNDPGAKSETNDEEGWSWDKENKILALDNYSQKISHGYYGIVIPCGTTIVLKGTNRIDMTTYNSAIYAQTGSGKVIIHGDGTLDITCPTNYGIHSDCGFDLLGQIEKGELRLKDGLTGSSDIESVLNSVTGLYETRIVTDNEPGIIFDEPEEKVIKASQGGTAPKISIEAKLIGATGPVSYKYQWYATDDWANPTEKAVPVVKGAELTASVKERGGKYYYCEVTATNNKKAYKKISDLYVVVVGAKGLEPVTEKIRLGSESYDHISDKGWSYDADTYTLTLNNLEAFIPYATNSAYYYDLFEIIGAASKPVHIVLAEGSVNHITECCYGITCNYGNALDFTGNGVLNFESGRSANIGLLHLTPSFKKLSISGGSVLNVYGGWNAIECRTVDITVSDAEATFDNLFSGSYCGDSNVHIATGGILNVVGGGEKEANTVTVDAGGALYLSGSGNSLVIDRTGGSGTLNISGILSVASDYAAITMFGADPESRINISDSVILVPEGKTLSELLFSTAGSRSYYCNGNLLIAPEDFERTTITGVPAITGEAKVGEVLTAGTVMPGGSTVSYSWQYAVSKDSPDELWVDTGITGENFTVDDIYVDKFIRVKAIGYGRYTGTVYSKPTIAVTANSVSIADFVVEEMHYGRLSGTYANYSPNVLYQEPMTGEVYVKVLADDENADITIKNITTGFTTKTDEEKTIIGAEGILPIYVTGAVNSNTVEITVTNGTKKAVYKAYIDYRISDAQVTLSAGEDTALILTDKLDTEVLRADKYVRSKRDNFPIGEKYTLTAISELNGWYVSKIRSNKYPNCGELIAGKRVAEIVMPNQGVMTFEVRDEDLRCIAPEVDAYWTNTAVGYGIMASWADPLPVIDHDIAYTGRISAELFDEEGNEIRLKEASVSNPQGFSAYWEMMSSGIITARDEADNELSLDPAKSYVLRLWYDAGAKERCDVQEIFIPAMDLSVNNHHIVVEKPALGETADVKIDVNGRAFRVETYPVTAEVTVNPVPEGGAAVVSVTSDAEVGTVYALLYVLRPNGSIVSEPLAIDVIEPSAEVFAGLTTISGSMNIYSNDTVTIPINIIGSAKPIISAGFVDSNNTGISDKYVIEAISDRELEIKPVIAPDSDETDWAAVAKSYTGTFKARIEVELEGGNTYTTNDYFTLKINAAAPKISATAVKLNSFYQADKAAVIFKANGEIVEAKVDTVKTKGKTVACPEWINLADNGKALVLDNSRLTNKKGSGKVLMKVWVDGYRIPAQLAVSVSATYSEPKIKLDNTTLTLPASHAKYGSYAQIGIISGDKKIAFDNLDIAAVRVATPTDLAELNAKDKLAYATSKYYKVNSYNKENGVIQLDAYTSSVSELPQMPAGKILLYAVLGGDVRQRVALPLTIKTMEDSKVTLKMSQKTITLNSNKEIGSEVVKVSLIPSATNYDCSGATYTVTDTRGKGDYSDKLDISNVRNEYSFAINALTQNGTYRVNISVPGIAKPAVLDVVVKDSIPALKTDKKSVNIDVFGDFKEAIGQKVTLTLADATIDRHAGHFDYKVYDNKNKSADSELDVLITGSLSTPIVATIYANSNTKIGKYNIEFIYTMPGSGVESIAKVAVNVAGKLPTVKPSKTVVTLNSSLGKSDMATVLFTKPDTFSYGGYGISVIDKTNTVVENVVICDYNVEKGILKMYPGVNAVAGQTYKLAIATTVKGMNGNKDVNSTITVKMVAANKSTGKPVITQKITTKGSLELARGESQLEVIPSYTGWNAAIASGATNIPEVTWVIYAYQNKQPYQYGDVTYQYAGDEGKVADSTPSGFKDWFIDTDASDRIVLKLNPSNEVVQRLSELTDLTFKLELKTTYSDYYGTGDDLVLISTSNFKVKNGAIKLSAAQPNKVILNRYDRFDSKIVKVHLVDKDATSLKLVDVKLKDESTFDAKLIYVGGDYAYVAVGWKNDSIPTTIKAGNQTLEFYSEYNYIGREKCNGTVSLSVEVR